MEPWGRQERKVYHISMQQSFSSRPQNNPFSMPKQPETAEQQYAGITQALARKFIYDEATLRPEVIDREISRALSIGRLKPLEQEQGSLEGLRALLKGIEAHERANLIHTGSWQAAIQRLAEQHNKAPEDLSREEIAQCFSSFHFKDALLQAENETLQQYQRLLERLPEASIRLSQNIEINRTDIEVLINDIQARTVERISHTAERHAAIQDVDKRLAEIIARIPEEQWGKRFEVEEIYLLRRLIHSTDTGHLASVNHGTPRADLRPDLGSVDVELTAAGDVFAFQLKTFKQGVHAGTRANQEAVRARAHEKLVGSETMLVALEAEAIRESFEASLRQGVKGGTSRADKYHALEPISSLLQPAQRQRLLTVIGLSEADLALEDAEREKRIASRQALEAELREKREREMQKELELEAKKQALEAELHAKEQARIERLAEQQRAVEAEVQERLDRLAAEKRAKQEKVEQHLREVSQREQERREAERLAEEQARKKEEARIRREIAKKEKPDWPPANLEKILSAPLLKQMGLLPADWTSDARQFLAAKKRFFSLFAKPKKGSSEATEKDKPSDLFAEAFPHKDSLTNPSAEDIARWNALTK